MIRRPIWRSPSVRPLIGVVVEAAAAVIRIVRSSSIEAAPIISSSATS